MAKNIAYFDAKSKGLVQINNLKHFPIVQSLHDRMTPATLSPSPLAYEKLIHPTEMPCIPLAQKCQQMTQINQPQMTDIPG